MLSLESAIQLGAMLLQLSIDSVSGEVFGLTPVLCIMYP